MSDILLLFDLFITFFQIGLFTFGGGYAMIPLITDKVVSKGWAERADIIDYIAVSEATPGPFAINISTFIGMKEFGALGVVATTLGIAFPSFIIIIIIAKFFMKFAEYKGVKFAMTGLRPAVIGLIISAVITLAVTAFDINIDFSNLNFDFIKNIRFIEISIFIIVLILSRIKKLKINLYKIILVSAALGIIIYTVRDFIV